LTADKWDDAVMDTELWRFDEASLLNALMENIADSIYFKDRHCRLVRVSRKMAADLGFAEPAEIIGKTDIELFGEEFGQRTMIDDLRVMESGQNIIGLIESRALPNGETNWTSTTKLPIRDKSGTVIGMLGITREINELKRAELNLQYLATHDLLTGLPNRYLLFDRMEQTIRRARRNQSMFAVLYIDLDGFKGVNDRYGHHIGDQVLRQVADRLTANVRDSDTVARMGGDEFTIILDVIKMPEAALFVAQKIRAKIDKGFDVFAHQAKVTASIGISLYPTHGMDAETLLKVADQAMYQAKEKGNACMIFKPPQFPK
jgi:diguanylate cyclase (GGDEF)-like protein/PAS domain S-box-containing protein